MTFKVSLISKLWLPFWFPRRPSEHNLLYCEALSLGVKPWVQRQSNGYEVSNTPAVPTRLAQRVRYQVGPSQRGHQQGVYPAHNANQTIEVATRPRAGAYYDLSELVITGGRNATLTKGACFVVGFIGAWYLR